jgi:hypothetical protein
MSIHRGLFPSPSPQAHHKSQRRCAPIQLLPARPALSLENDQARLLGGVADDVGQRGACDQKAFKDLKHGAGNSRAIKKDDDIDLNGSIADT